MYLCFRKRLSLKVTVVGLLGTHSKWNVLYFNKPNLETSLIVLGYILVIYNLITKIQVFSSRPCIKNFHCLGYVEILRRWISPYGLPLIYTEEGSFVRCYFPQIYLSTWQNIYVNTNSNRDKFGIWPVVSNLYLYQSAKIC